MKQNINFFALCFLLSATVFSLTFFVGCDKVDIPTESNNSETSSAVSDKNDPDTNSKSATAESGTSVDEPTQNSTEESDSTNSKDESSGWQSGDKGVYIWSHLQQYWNDGIKGGIWKSGEKEIVQLVNKGDEDASITFYLEYWIYDLTADVAPGESYPFVITGVVESLTINIPAGESVYHVFDDYEYTHPSDTTGSGLYYRILEMSYGDVVAKLGEDF